MHFHRHKNLRPILSGRDSLLPNNSIHSPHCILTTFHRCYYRLSVFDLLLSLLQETNKRNDLIQTEGSEFLKYRSALDQLNQPEDENGQHLSRSYNQALDFSTSLHVEPGILRCV